MVMTNVVSESESMVSPIAGADEVANATDLRWYTCSGYSLSLAVSPASTTC